MATERIRAHIERLLDEIDEALTQRKWQEVQHLASEILDLDETNEDATTFLRMAERRLGTSDVPVATANESSEAPVPLTEPSLPAPKKDPTTFGDGRYEVKRFLGEGGKKMVYLAHDDTLDRDVAFALIKTEGLDSVGLTRISREAQAMGRLGSHPHIVTVFDLGDHEGQPYMVTELMGGGDVEGIIEDAPDNRLSLDQCVNIAIETCRGLEFAHSKGIVHRDLKPGNVWLTADGIAKIGDFGLAVTSDRSRLTQEGMMVGTVSYMPPEQAMGGDVTQRADLYSLGAMMYEMVTGRPPFLGDDSIAIIGQHINTPPVAPTWHNAGCPKPLEALILRLLAKNPDERPESASDVLTVMERLELPRSGEQPSATVSSASTEEESNVLDGVASGIFVGRQQEMGDLKAALEDVLSGRGKMVTLVGEPGIGKTRTSQELATYAGLRGAKVLWGRCYEEQGVPPYWPWVQAIRTYVRDEEPQKLSTEMGAGAADISEVVPDVRTQLPGLPQSTQLEPEQARFRLFDAITAFLRSASQSRPLVIVLDDLHWADKPSLLLLQFIARELDNSRLMMVGTYRDMELSRQHPLSESLGELTRERAFQRVLLRGLSQDDVSRFIEVAAGVDPDQGLVNAVYTQTEGNPLFVTEVVRLLVQEGQLNQASNLNTMGRQTESWTVRIPEGVREVIGRRLNKLTERCNETLTVASIVGREFEFDQLKTLVDDLSDDMLLDVLEEALSARVIEEMPDSIGRYQFTHALLQETLMDELSLTRRVRLHARIAESLEALYGALAEEHATELVFHFEQAQAMLGTEKLINYSVIAGNAALANSAFEDALKHFENCVSIASEGEIDQKGAEILVGYGKAGVSLGDPVRTRAEFVPSLERAFRYFKDSDQIENALSVADFPHSTLVQTLMKPVQQMALDMVKPDSLEAAKILSILGYSLGMTETDIQPSRDAFDKALIIARQADDRALVVRILANYANILAFFRQWDEAFVMAKEVIDREEDSRDPVDSLRALLWAANSSTQTGQLEKAYSLAQQMMGRAERRRDHYWLGRAYTALLEVQTANGNFPEVIRLGTAAAERGITDTYVTTLCIAAKMQIGMDHKEFVSMLESSLGSNRMISPAKGASTLTGVNAVVFASIPILQAGVDAEHIVEYLKSFISAYLDQDGQLVEYQLPLWERMVRFVSGHYAVYTENIDLAASQYKRMTELPGPSSDFFLGAERTCLMGEISALLGDVDGADLNFSQSLVNCRDKGWKPSLAWTLFKYADFLLKRDEKGGRDKAGPMLDEALKLATDMGMEPLMQSVLSKRELLKA